MDNKVFIRLLNHKLEEIDSLLNSFDQSSVIHDIEIDILLSKIRILYDDVKLLAQLDSSSDKTEGIPIPQDIIPEFSKPMVLDDHTKIPEPELVSEPSVPVEPVITPESEVVPDTSITQNPNSNIFSGVKMQAVDDIMVAIGLNDRFLFTRELFDNDAENFTKTISALNQKDDWGQASAYLNEHFQWDTEDPTLILFLSFVKRRYI